MVDREQGEERRRCKGEDVRVRFRAPGLNAELACACWRRRVEQSTKEGGRGGDKGALRAALAARKGSRAIAAKREGLELCGRRRAQKC